MNWSEVEENANKERFGGTLDGWLVGGGGGGVEDDKKEVGKWITVCCW